MQVLLQNAPKSWDLDPHSTFHLDGLQTSTVALLAQVSSARVSSARLSGLGFVALFVMPLSQKQQLVLKNADTKIMVQMENPKKIWSKAWDGFEKDKHAKSIGQATQTDANWQDVSVDFERGFLKVMGNRKRVRLPRCLLHR